MLLLILLSLLRITATTTNPATTSIATTRKGNMLILVMLLALPLLLLVTLDTTTSNSKYLNTTSMTSITITPKGMKGIFSSFFFGGGGELNHNTLSVCRLSKGRYTNILRTVWFVKLKLTGLVVGDVELTKSKYLHPSVTVSTHSS
jgi:hypothetical protein